VRLDLTKHNRKRWRNPTSHHPHQSPRSSTQRVAAQPPPAPQPTAQLSAAQPTAALMPPPAPAPPPQNVIQYAPAQGQLHQSHVMEQQLYGQPGAGATFQGPPQTFHPSQGFPTTQNYGPAPSQIRREPSPFQKPESGPHPAFQTGSTWDQPPGWNQNENWNGEGPNGWGQNQFHEPVFEQTPPFSNWRGPRPPGGPSRGRGNGGGVGPVRITLGTNPPGMRNHVPSPPPNPNPTNVQSQLRDRVQCPTLPRWRGNSPNCASTQPRSSPALTRSVNSHVNPNTGGFAPCITTRRKDARSTPASWATTKHGTP
jgi:hypothetical protein